VNASAAGQGSVEAANYNAQGQVVIAGSTALVQCVMKAKEQSGKAIALPVSFRHIVPDETSSRKVC
jgi:[acyl-carrier-protein] S-malonyltransferase